MNTDWKWRFGERSSCRSVLHDFPKKFDQVAVSATMVIERERERVRGQFQPVREFSSRYKEEVWEERNCCCSGGDDDGLLTIDPIQ